jgi:hypothetical protein
MRSGRALLFAALASLAAACGHHQHDDHEWTAEELAELEHKWGMEVSYLFLPLTLREMRLGRVRS